MPNHVTTIIKASKTVLDAMKGEESVVDFNSLIPMDKSLKVDAASTIETAYGVLWGEGGCSFLGLDELVRRFRLMSHEEQLESVRGAVTYRENKIKHGHETWYGWAYANWGTKWNAYEASEVDGGVCFESAWSTPQPVIDTLRAKFPDETIEHLWADEDMGSNLGHVIYKDGVITPQPIDDPIDFALTVKEDDRQYYRLNEGTGKWEYYDGEESDQ